MDPEIIRTDRNKSAHIKSEFSFDQDDTIPLSLINDLLTSKNEDEYLDYLVHYAESLYPEKMRAVIFKTDSSQTRLLKASSPSLPVIPKNIREQGLEIGPDLTTTAKAVYHRKPIFCGDVTKDPSWSIYSSDAGRLKIKACWSFPIYSSDKEVLGAFSFYFDETLDLPPKILPLIQGFVNIAGLGMEKWKSHQIQNKTLQDLKASEDRLHSALKVRAMGICDYEFKTSRLVWDDAMLSIFGIERKDFVEDGSTWFMHVHADDRNRVVRELEIAIATKTNLETKYRILRQGELRYLKSSCSISFTPDNHPQRLIGLVWDITERTLAQRKLEEERTKAIASAKMASLGEMASSIAHEINNPLTIILNRASHLREKIETGKIDLAGSATELVKIEDTVGRIAKIIRGLSAFSRNSENDPMIECELHSIITDSFELCRERFVKEGIEIRIFGLPKNLMINCRPSQISQVLINLINNSFDALQGLKEKWLGIHVKEIDHNRVEISVIDSGPGIPEAVAEKIMVPFFTTKEIGHGTGLGLSISKGIIEDHYGKLSYDKNHTNTRFVITLPIAR